VTSQEELPDSVPGIELAHSVQDRVVIAKIDTNSPFADSDLMVGQVLLAINKEIVPASGLMHCPGLERFRWCGRSKDSSTESIPIDKNEV